MRIPEECAVARVENYGGDPDCEFNGMLVQIAGYEHSVGYFMGELVDASESYEAGHTVLFAKEELVPLNEMTKLVMESLESSDE